jgi:hypothetical protein
MSADVGRQSHRVCGVVLSGKTALVAELPKVKPKTKRHRERERERERVRESNNFAINDGVGWVALVSDFLSLNGVMFFSEKL